MSLESSTIPPKSDISPVWKEFSQMVVDQGFSHWGIAPAQIPEADKKNLEAWVEDGRHGSMKWFPRKQKLRLGFEGLGFHPRSVIVLAMLYRSPVTEALSQSIFIDQGFHWSQYAMGEDYHDVLKKKAKPLKAYLKSHFPGHKFRQGVDSLPLAEKILAREAGMGWVGKNTLLIHPEKGSFFFLSTILTTLEIKPFESISFQPIVDRCGKCTACIDSCPTKALMPYQIDARLCISHNNIEDRENLSLGLTENHHWAFGCDICQEVCPWNRVVSRKKGMFSQVGEFLPKGIFEKEAKKLPFISEEEFEEVFEDSAVKRIGYSKFKRNLE